MEKETNDKGVQEKKPAEGVKFFPDIEYNKAERRKTVVMSVILVFLMGGMGITFFISGRGSENGTMIFISGALMIFLLVLAISMIPSGFKQYPTKNEPIIEVKPKEATINGETHKISDILQVRLTIALQPVGNKAENEKAVDALLDKEPEKGITANVDVAVRDKGDKSKTLFTTVKGGYEALLAFYKAGVKNYSIVYSMKKVSKQSTYDLGNTVTENGTKLSQISKKERLKQLY